jgi:hypothetical protein
MSKKSTTFDAHTLLSQQIKAMVVTSGSDKRVIDDSLRVLRKKAIKEMNDTEFGVNFIH